MAFISKKPASWQEAWGEVVTQRAPKIRALHLRWRLRCPL